jgi:hypothetical protein
MDLVQRLEANSTWEPNSGCRIWLGSLKRDHGEIKVAGQAMPVHRVAWELERGPIPDGLWVLHTCGLGPCFNVNHLRLGTRFENARDRFQHGGYLGKPGGGLLAQARVLTTRGKPFLRTTDALLDQSEIKRILSYDPQTGELKWRLRADRDRSWNHRFVGEIAGAVLTNGYRYINFNGKLHTAHRVAWLYMIGEWPASQVDHVNRDRADNRWANLRLATQSENSANQGLRTNNKSGIRGVSWDKKKRNWVAMITVNYKQKRLGNFATLEEAAEARRLAEDTHHGDFAYQGVN